MSLPSPPTQLATPIQCQLGGKGEFASLVHYFPGDNVAPSYLRPRYAQIYTFYLTTLASSSVVALTIDDIPVSLLSVLRAGPLLLGDRFWVSISLLPTVRSFQLQMSPRNHLARFSSSSQNCFMTSRLSFSPGLPPRRFCCNGKLSSTRAQWPNPSSPRFGSFFKRIPTGTPSR